MIRRFTIAALMALALSGCYVADMNVFADVNGTVNAKTDITSGSTKTPFNAGLPAGEEIADVVAPPEDGVINGRVSRMSGRTYEDLTIWATKPGVVATTSVQNNGIFKLDKLPRGTGYRVAVTTYSTRKLTYTPDNRPVLPFRADKEYLSAPVVSDFPTSKNITALLIITNNFDDND